MACRVGMTMDLGRRTGEWERHYSKVWGWQILDTYSTKAEAQKAEKVFAAQYGCVAHGGGRGNEYETWHVYFMHYEE